MKQRKRGPMQDELTEAMHGEFTVDAETERRHKVETARAVVASGHLAPAKATEVYGVTVEEITAPRPGPSE